MKYRKRHKLCTGNILGTASKKTPYLGNLNLKPYMLFNKFTHSREHDFPLGPFMKFHCQINISRGNIKNFLAI